MEWHQTWNRPDVYCRPMNGPVRAALVFQAGLAVLGWGALAWLVTRTYPDQSRALLAVYGAVFVALSATAACAFWLVVAGLGRSSVPRTPLAFLTHGMVFSALALFGLWLQSLRLLSPLHVVLLAGLFLFFELAVGLGSQGS